MQAEQPTPHLDEIIGRMDERLAELARSGDRRERFLLMYRTFKAELRKNLKAGRFSDPEWAEAICCRMGEMYFEADDAFGAGVDGCPDPWLHCFRLASGRRTNLLQDMLLGMNAHINYDLPFCTFHTMDRFGDADELRRDAPASLPFRRLLKRRYYDFLLINEIAWESIPLIQDVVCERFSRPLKYANILSFRFSRPIAERIICEYRDRAWAHTLVLLTAPDDGAVKATEAHITIFAMRAAGLVERLSFNPIRLVRAWLAARKEPPASLSIDPTHDRVVRTLVDHLGRRPTRAIARQALIEYGDEVQPILAHLLDRAPPLAHVRAQLYPVLAAHPTPTAVATLAGALRREREARDPLLEAVATLRRRKLDLEPLLPAAREVARQEIEEAERLSGLMSAVDPKRPQSALLIETLRARLGRALRRAQQASGEPALDVRGPRPDDADTAVAELLSSDGDPWLRAAAAWWISGAANPAVVPLLVERLEQEDHELVKETLLAAAVRLLPPDRAAAAAERLLHRPTYVPDSQARRYARMIAGRSDETMITTIEKVLHLKNVRLFQDILAEDLTAVARVAKEHRFRNGERLIRRGMPGEAAYVVVSGRVDVIGDRGQRLATVGPGGVLGEMSVVSDVSTSADCVAREKGVALRIARADFHALLQDHPTTGIGVMHVLAERLRRTNEQAMGEQAVAREDGAAWSAPDRSPEPEHEESMPAGTGQPKDHAVAESGGGR